MWSKKTIELHNEFNASRKVDFKRYVVKIADEFSKYLKNPIQYVECTLTSEYDDNGGYYDTIESVTFMDAEKNRLYLEDIDSIHPDYVDEENEGISEEVPEDYELNEIFWECSDEIKEFGLDETLINVEEYREELKNEPSIDA